MIVHFPAAVRYAAAVGILLCMACDPDGSPRRVTVSGGYVVLGTDGHTVKPFAAGDTLVEIDPHRAPPILRVLIRRVVRDSGMAAACTRLFRGRGHFAVGYLSSCEPKPRWTHLQDAPRMLFGVYDSLGRSVTNGAFLDWFGEFPITVMCPQGRTADGRWAPDLPLDGCSRRAPVGDWRRTPPGIRTPHGVIFPDPIKRALFTRCSRPAPQQADGEWTPSLADIAKLERALPAYLQRAEHVTRFSAGAVDSIVPLGAYLRQYGGFTRGGKRFIYVSFFARELAMPSDEHWLRYPLGMCDGGWGYFGVVYDAETGEFSELVNNGYA